MCPFLYVLFFLSELQFFFLRVLLCFPELNCIFPPCSAGFLELQCQLSVSFRISLSLSASPYALSCLLDLQCVSSSHFFPELQCFFKVLFCLPKLHCVFSLSPYFHPKFHCLFHVLSRLLRLQCIFVLRPRVLKSTRASACVFGPCPAVILESPRASVCVFGLNPYRPFPMS